jgi:hypothetical protein
VIPAGVTGQLQPFHVSVNRFKDYFRKEYKASSVPEKLPLTPSGKIKKASASDLQNGSRTIGGSQEKQLKSLSTNFALKCTIWHRR